MTKEIRARIHDTSKEIVIEDVEPLASAALFWKISDAIWDQRPGDHMLTSWSVASVLPVEDARNRLNEVLAKIDEELAISGNNTPLGLPGSRAGETIELGPHALSHPSQVHIGTMNWDQQCTFRSVTVDDRRTAATFTDGHTDRLRELYASFSFRQERSAVNLRYSMQRYQPSQDGPTSLSMNIWHSALAESGYEGSQLAYTGIDEAQEMDVLKVFQDIGGIILGPEAGGTDNVQAKN